MVFAQKPAKLKVAMVDILPEKERRSRPQVHTDRHAVGDWKPGTNDFHPKADKGEGSTEAR
jgi:hypothetical protein